MKVSVILKELDILHIFYFTKKSVIKIDQWFLYNFLSRKESTGNHWTNHSFEMKNSTETKQINY